jgi:methionine-rich copper-binding protein CopC
VVTWQATSADNLTSHVFVQRFDTNNNTVGDPIQLDGLVSGEVAPRVTPLANGGFVVAWYANSTENSTIDVFVQHFDANNTSVRPTLLVGLGGDDSAPQITSLADGGYVVTWKSISIDGSKSDVFVQRFDADSSAVGVPHALDGLGGHDSTPQVTALADGGYVVTWQAFTSNNSTSDVFVQRFDADSSAVGDPHALNGLEGHDSMPQVTALADGGYAVTWQAFTSDNSTSDVFVQRFDADNSAVVLPPTQFDGQGGGDFAPQVTALTDGGYVVTWHATSADQLLSDVVWKRFDSNNDIVGDSGLLDVLDGSDRSPQLTALADGGYAVSWLSSNSDHSVIDVVVQRLDYHVPLQVVL